MPPQNSRPRYVNPPQELTAPVTPPFVQQQDPYAGLLQVLSNLSNPVSQPQQSKFQQIMNMIANAAAVGISNDPGAALAQQFAQQRQERLMQQQQMQERQNMLDQLKIDIALKKGDQLAQQQYDTQKEERQRKYKLEDRELDLKEKIDAENRRLEDEKAKELWKLDHLRDDLEIREQVKLKYAEDWLGLEEKTTKIKNYDKKLGDAIELSSAYQLADPDTDPTKFDKIAKKRLGIIQEPLDEEEVKLLKRANKIVSIRETEKHQASIARMRQLAGGPRRGGRVTADPSKVFLDTAKRNLANTIFDSQYVETFDKGIVEVKNATKNLFGQPDETKIKRYLSPQENYQRSLQILNDMSKAGALPQQPTQQPQKGLRQELSTRIQQAKQNGMSAQQINLLLEQSKQEDPANAELYEGFKVKETTQPLGSEQQKFGQGPSYEELKKKAIPIKGKVKISVN